MTKYTLSKEEVKNLISRRAVINYVSSLVNADENKYLEDIVFKRLDIPSGSKVSIDLNDGWLEVSSEESDDTNKP